MCVPSTVSQLSVKQRKTVNIARGAGPKISRREFSMPSWLRLQMPPPRQNWGAGSPTVCRRNTET
eukprot:2671388-Heterocapsa_arctica.AAC.1